MADFKSGENPFANDSNDIPSGVSPFGEQPQQQSASQPVTNTVGQEAKRQAGLTGRYLVEAAASPFVIGGDAIGKGINEATSFINKHAGTNIPQFEPYQRGLKRTLDKYFPVPERPIEQFTQAVAQTAPAVALPASMPVQAAGNAFINSALAQPGDEYSAATVGAIAGAAPNIVVDVLRGFGKGASNLLGMTTGAGGESVRQAFKGGPDFVANMRGNVEPSAVVDQARQGVQKMRQNMYDSYARARGGWAGDTTPLNLAPIQKTLADASAKYSFQGIPQPGVQGVQEQTATLIGDWIRNAQQNPAFATVEGLDALKRHLQDLTPDYNNRTGRAYVTELVNGVKDTITQQAPKYSEAMRDYWQRSSDLDEITRSLSLGDRATIDTALRKLQSLMRNNVNTNYGQRMVSAEALAREGGQDVRPAVAGQALNTWTPRGLQSAVVAGGGGIAALLNPWALAAMPAFSPRAVGEIANTTGRAIFNPYTQATIDALRNVPTVRPAVGKTISDKTNRNE